MLSAKVDNSAKQEWRGRKQVKPTKSPIFATYWRFAAERQDIFFRRAKELAPPWTTDRVLSEFKFTNAYRVTDRVSQFLVQHVIRENESDPDEVFFRIVLFKLFNRIETWRFLESHFGEVTWKDYSFPRYSRALESAKAANGTIYSAAYIMPPGRTAFGFVEKHKNHLLLLEQMIADHLPERLAASESMDSAFNLLLAYPTIGPFLAFQYVIDLNYSNLLNFSEMDFVVAGPGARSGLRKCFADPGDYSNEDLIRWVTDSQEREFSERGLSFRDLWGRRLQLIDCQNLFCEVDKYARVAHPELSAGRNRIKQRFRPTGEMPPYRFPFKWGIHDRVRAWYGQQVASSAQEGVSA